MVKVKPDEVGVVQTDDTLFSTLAKYAEKIALASQRKHYYGRDGMAAIHAHLPPDTADTYNRLNAIQLLDLLSQEKANDSVSTVLKAAQTASRNVLLSKEYADTLPDIIESLDYDPLVQGFSCNALGLAPIIFYMIVYYSQGYYGKHNMKPKEMAVFSEHIEELERATEL